MCNNIHNFISLFYNYMFTYTHFILPKQHSDQNNIAFNTLNISYLSNFINLAIQLQNYFQKYEKVDFYVLSYFIDTFQQVNLKQMKEFSNILISVSQDTPTYIQTTMLIFFMEIVFPIIQKYPSLEKQALDSIESLLIKNPQIINQASSLGMTPFMLAVYYYPIPNSPFITLFTKFKAQTAPPLDIKALLQYFISINQAYDTFQKFNPLKHTMELRDTNSNPNESNLLTRIEQDLSNKIPPTEWTINKEFFKLNNEVERLTIQKKQAQLKHNIASNNQPRFQPIKHSPKNIKNTNVKTANPLKDYSIITPLQDIPNNTPPYSIAPKARYELPQSNTGPNLFPQSLPPL
jgi:hypothetical protein